MSAFSPGGPAHLPGQAVRAEGPVCEGRCFRSWNFLRAIWMHLPGTDSGSRGLGLSKKVQPQDRGLGIGRLEEGVDPVRPKAIVWQEKKGVKAESQESHHLGQSSLLAVLRKNIKFLSTGRKHAVGNFPPL